MIETDFGWALAKMRDGYKVRRKVWPPQGAITMVADNTRIITRHGVEVNNVPLEDVLAYDWELAE
jgi:hypothetical protein